MENSTNGKFHLWKIPSMDNSTYGNFTWEKFHLWKISPMDNSTYEKFYLRKIPPMEDFTYGQIGHISKIWILIFHFIQHIPHPLWKRKLLSQNFIQLSDFFFLTIHSVGSTPLDPVCFRIEDPSRNKLSSTAYKWNNIQI